MSDAPDSDTRRERLAVQRKALPDSPGVYLFRDVKSKVIYVGKAKSIRKRVAGHFSGKGGNILSSGDHKMIDEIETVEYVVVGSEAEALLAEQNFIKQYRPRFNIRLRDDKSYPYIAISMDEKFPRVYFTREKHRRDRLYFGPYSNAKRVRGTLDLLGKVFLFRSCTGSEPGRRSGSPCLDYYIKRCGAPCVDYVTRGEYSESIQGVIAFLSGRYREIEADLEAKMKAAADEQNFEQAALERNRLRSVQHLLERQRVANEGVGTLDAIAVALDGTDANAQVFQIRDGTSPTASRSTSTTRPSARRRGDRGVRPAVRRHLRDPAAGDRRRRAGRLRPLAEALGQQRGSLVEVRTAQRGEAAHLRHGGAQRPPGPGRELKAERGRQQRTEALDTLRDELRLDTVPIRIECFDISTLMGTNTVASMVVFEGGAPKKSDYRRFTIRTLEHGHTDDFAAMEEVLTRRMAQWVTQQDLSPHDPKYNASFATLPNLIVIDGGKGQLAAGLRALQPFVDRGVAVVSLAKRIEEVFTPGIASPLVLPHDTPALQLCSRVRDEATASITHHRNRRDTAMTSSVIDEALPAWGRGALLKHFGSRGVPGRHSRGAEQVRRPQKVAREVYATLHRTG